MAQPTFSFGTNPATSTANTFGTSSGFSSGFSFPAAAQQQQPQQQQPQQSMFQFQQQQQQQQQLQQFQQQQQQQQQQMSAEQQEQLILQQREQVLSQQQQGFAALGGIGPGMEHLYKSASAWDIDSPNCQFLHYFYNVVPPEVVGNYRPTVADSPKLYVQAQRDNPDPKRMVPVLAAGFANLEHRIEKQERKEEEFRAALKSVKDKVNDIYRKHSLDTNMKLEEYRLRQITLVHKTLQLLRDVQLIRMQDSSIREDEEKLKSKLESLNRELQKPSVFRGRLHEIWTHVQQIKSFKYFAPEMYAKDEIRIDGEQQLEMIYQTLKGHQEGFTILKTMLEGYRRELEQMRKGSGDGAPYSVR